MGHTPPNAEYERLLTERAERLADLRTCKPGQKHYRRSLKAFLDVDAKSQKALLKQIEQEPRHFATADSSRSPDPEA